MGNIKYMRFYRKMAKKQTFHLIAIFEPNILEMSRKCPKKDNFLKIQEKEVWNWLHPRHMWGNHSFYSHHIKISPLDGNSYGKMHTFWAKKHWIFKLIVEILKWYQKKGTFLMLQKKQLRNALHCLHTWGNLSF